MSSLDAAGSVWLQPVSPSLFFSYFSLSDRLSLHDLPVFIQVPP